METYVRARIDSELKGKAEEACRQMGISMSDYIRLSFAKLVEETPNAETRNAMTELENGKGRRGKASDVMAMFNRAKPT